MESNRQVSFSKLQDLYNKKFNIRDNDDEHFMEQKVQELIFYISKVIVELTRVPTAKFDLDKFFARPVSTQEDFIISLNKEPFFCTRKEHEMRTLEALAKKYESNYQRVNTDRFVQELEKSVWRLKHKDVIYREMQKSILKKNSSVEKVFEEAISDIKRFRMDAFKPEEFYQVIIYLEIKNVSLDQLRDMLQNFQEPDKEGKYSVADFIKDFKKMNDTAPAAARKGRKFYQTREEIIKRIVFVIEHRNIQNLGQLLADQDLDEKRAISRDQFYRLIDSFKFGLGEADIQELMRAYALKNSMVDIDKFKDDLNMQIVDPQHKVELKSKLTAILNTRVIEPIENKEVKQIKVDPKMQAKF